MLSYQVLFCRNLGVDILFVFSIFIMPDRVDIPLGNRCHAISSSSFTSIKINSTSWGSSKYAISRRIASNNLLRAERQSVVSFSKLHYIMYYATFLSYVLLLLPLRLFINLLLYSLLKP